MCCRCIVSLAPGSSILATPSVSKALYLKMNCQKAAGTLMDAKIKRKQQGYFKSVKKAGQMFEKASWWKLSKFGLHLYLTTDDRPTSLQLTDHTNIIKRGPNVALYSLITTPKYPKESDDPIKLLHKSAVRNDSLSFPACDGLSCPSCAWRVFVGIFARVWKGGYDMVPKCKELPS